MLDDAELEAIEARCQAASPGPWKAFLFTSLRDDPAEADVVSHKLLGIPSSLTVSPRSVAAGVEVTNRASGERSVPMKDVGAEVRGAA